ncbi:type III-A CRISPR-associated protein Csm2 [Bacteroides sp. AN502(2024)]|uniref:type III-A CRISPR-associated protein Csm2 n=1 Tax=Bacteroides sp. AN502(2024) TaxID=3160599 RepID=UPI003513321A
MSYDEKMGGRSYRSQNNQSYVLSRDRDIADAKSFFLNQLSYQSNWITEKADKALVEFAEKAGKYMAENNLTNSKIRSIYGEIKRIQMKTFEKDKASFFLLKPKVAYALGREQKDVKGLQLFKSIFDKSFDDVTNETQYLNFCNLIEAILAYHKAYGGKD